jgi:hypothetical protein
LALLVAALRFEEAIAEEPGRTGLDALPASRDTAPPAARIDLPVHDGMVRLNFPAEVEVKALVDYVSQRLGVKIIDDEQIANKKVCIKGPGEIPVSSLVGLLESALKMKGMASCPSCNPVQDRLPSYSCHSCDSWTNVSVTPCPPKT